MNVIIISIIAATLYLLAGILLGTRLFRSSGGKLQPKFATLSLSLGGIMLHAAILYQAIITAHGINLGFFNSISLVAWLIASLLIVAAITKPVENLGIVLFPLAALTLVLTILFPSQQVTLETAAWEMKTHILTSIIAYSLFSIAAMQAVLLAIQDHHLRNRHPGGFIRALPPLQTMESLLFQMIGVGFVCLSISLFTGVIFLEDIFAQHLVHKTLLSLTAWCVFAVLLWGRHRFGWRSRTAIRWTMAGFIVLMLAYFGSKLVVEVILQR